MNRNRNSRRRAEGDWLRGADDLLVDFDRAVHIFNEFVSGRRGR
jgi:hypothetical protein